ncbi:DUF3806 domain-containing protein [Aurantivibrio plasticivorans]
MTAQIEAPSGADMEKIALLLACSQEIASEALGQTMDASLDDLNRIQALLDEGIEGDQKTLALQALGMTFGQVIATQNTDYDWWIIDDEDGRDPCLRFGETELLIYPQTIISRRIEAGETVDVSALYHSLCEQLDEVAQHQLSAHNPASH